MALFWVLALQCVISAFASEAPTNIVNGQRIKITDAPYTAVLKPMYCGGSIISDRLILSAAQCFKERPEADDVQVGVGADNRDDLEYFKVESYKVHPMYDSALNDYDVAVIRLKKPLKFTNKIKAVPLAGFKHHTNGLFELDLNLVFFNHTRVTGWGDTAVGIHSPSKHLLKADGIVVPWFLCKDLEKIFGKDISDRMICASDIIDGGDRCLGDSGGPLISMETRAQIGIASWGDSCGKRLHPGVYTSITNPSIAKFILQELNAKK